MKTIHFHSNIQYELLEFHYYIGSEDINIVELLLNTDDLSSIEQDFSTTFIIKTDINTFILSDYELSEYYIENGKVKVVCIK